MQDTNSPEPLNNDKLQTQIDLLRGCESEMETGLNHARGLLDSAESALNTNVMHLAAVSPKYRTYLDNLHTSYRRTVNELQMDCATAKARTLLAEELKLPDMDEQLVVERAQAIEDLNRVARIYYDCVVSVDPEAHLKPIGTDDEQEPPTEGAERKDPVPMTKVYHVLKWLHKEIGRVKDKMIGLGQRYQDIEGETAADLADSAGKIGRILDAANGRVDAMVAELEKRYNSIRTLDTPAGAKAWIKDKYPRIDLAAADRAQQLANPAGEAEAREEDADNESAESAESAQRAAQQAAEALRQLAVDEAIVQIGKRAADKKKWLDSRDAVSDRQAASGRKLAADAVKLAGMRSVSNADLIRPQSVDKQFRLAARTQERRADELVKIADDYGSVLARLEEGDSRRKELADKVKDYRNQAAQCVRKADDLRKEATTKGVEVAYALARTRPLHAAFIYLFEKGEVTGATQTIPEPTGSTPNPFNRIERVRRDRNGNEMRDRETNKPVKGYFEDYHVTLKNGDSYTFVAHYHFESLTEARHIASCHYKTFADRFRAYWQQAKAGSKAAPPHSAGSDKEARLLLRALSRTPPAPMDQALKAWQGDTRERDLIRLSLGMSL